MIALRCFVPQHDKCILVAEMTKLTHYLQMKLFSYLKEEMNNIISAGSQ